jgi:hypothetical protein
MHTDVNGNIYRLFFLYKTYKRAIFTYVDVGVGARVDEYEHLKNVL